MGPNTGLGLLCTITISIILLLINLDIIKVEGKLMVNIVVGLSLTASALLTAYYWRRYE